jgi:hypothetical protein
VADPNNRRQHNARNIGLIADTLQAVGFGRSVVIDEHDVVLAGNGVLEAAAEVGLTKVLTVETDGTTLVAVRRRGLTADQKRTLAIADNRATELSTWNVEQLAADLDAGLSLDQWFRPDESAALLAQLKPRSEADPDDVPTMRATDISQGDLFTLGSHRICCGDSTDPVVVAAVLGDDTPLLCATDAPYGVRYDPSWRVGVHGGFACQHALGAVTNDDRIDWTAAFRLFAGDVIYAWHAGVHAPEVGDALRALGFDLRAQIVWVKQAFALSRGAYHWQHEPAWYAVRQGRTAHWQGDRTQSTVWQVASLNPAGGSRADENAPTGHSTQKPVALFEKPYLNHTRSGDAVFEPFSGSGTAMIAAERTGRRCLAIELEPAYVQLAVDRWEQFTGHRAHKVGEVSRA